MRCRECVPPPPPPLACRVSSAAPSHPATRLLTSGCPTLMCLCDSVVCRKGREQCVSSMGDRDVAVREFYSRMQSMGETLAEYSRALIRLHRRIEAAAPTVEEHQALAVLVGGALKHQFFLSVYGMSGCDMS